MSTHLEPFHPLVQLAQAGELLSGPGDTEQPVVFLGDYNSDGEASSPPTYTALMAAGLADAWVAANPGDPGYTWGQDGDLLNPTATLSERLDLVLLRNAMAPPPFSFTVKSAVVLGSQAEDRTPTGLWLSDHAGVMATVQLSAPGEGRK